MKNKRNFSILCMMVLVVLQMVQITNSQTTPELLTNAKIIEMFKLGLGEDIIIAKIRQTKCNCQTDTDSLIQLKNAKVPNTIILEMMNASPTAKSGNGGNTTVPTTSSNPSSNEDKGILSQITEPGIYVNVDGELKLIEPSVFSGTKSNFLGSALTYGIKKTKMRATVRGKTANMILSNPAPEFYFVFNPNLSNSGATMGGLFWGMPATSPAEFVLVQMKVKDNSREAIIGEYGLTGMSTGTSDKEIREYGFEKLKPGVYKVNPKQNLANGEYCFYFASNVVGLGVGGGKIFDFSIGVKP